MSIARSTAVQDRATYGQHTPADTKSTEESTWSPIDGVNGCVAHQSRDGTSARADNLHKTFASRPDQGEDRLTEVVNLPVLGKEPRLTTTLHPLQEWEGYVVQINRDGFTARLLDVTAGASYEGEEADIPLEEVSESDVAKMKVGSIFRWVIGYERAATGTKRRISQIVFRDLPAITEKDLQVADEWARGLMAAWKE